MPNIITHALFADDILDLLDCKELSDHKQLFEIGANGPDILFFHNLSLRGMARPTKLHKLGSMLHEGGMKDFYRSALDSIRKEKNLNIKEEMIAYVCGHLCHWALDSVVHPYVYYRTGVKGSRSSFRHHRLESLLDAAMLKIKRQTTIHDFDITEEVCKTTPDQERAIARIYIPALEAVFGEKIRPYLISETLHDWKDMQKVFRDPYGSKLKTARMLERLTGMQNLLSGYSVPAEFDDNWDIMNLNHKIWKHPITEEESTESVLDLYKKAKRRALMAIELFLKAVSHTEDEEAFLDYVKDINYNMGMPNNEGMHCVEITEFFD